MYLTDGFIVSSHAYDTASGICYEAWFCSDKGPIKTTSVNENALFFIKSKDAEIVNEILAAESLTFNVKSLGLKNFQQEEVSACYFNSLKHFYSAAKALKQRGVVLFEEDIRPIERYLMERFIKGGAWITGNVFYQNGYTLVTEAKLKANDEYSPALNKLSLDIECNESGVLFSVGLVGCNLDCVLMIGEPDRETENLEFDIIWCVDEAELLRGGRAFY